MRSSTKTTLFRLAATAAVVVAARSVPIHGERRPSLSSAGPAAVAPAETSSSSREEATAAAQRILAAFATFPGLPVAEAHARLRGIASIGAMDHLVGELDADLARLADGYPGGPTKVWHGILASRETGSDESARVDVWFDRVVAPPARPVYVEWRLATLRLLWERDGWRLDRFEETAGPRPLELPGSADLPELIFSALDGFTPEGS